MNLSRHFNVLMTSALSVSLALTPMVGIGVAHAQSAPAAEAPSDAGWQKEFEAWRTASKRGAAADYEAYLKAYPAGKFSSVAKKRIDDLSKPADTAKVDKQQSTDVASADTTTMVSTDDAAADAEKAKDLDMWREVSKTGTQADYEKYLKSFPKGKFAKVAQTRLDAMTADASKSADVQTAQADDTKTKPNDQAQADDQQTQAADTNTEVAQTTTVDNSQADQQDQASSQDNGQKNDKATAPASDWEQEYALWKAASDGNTVTEYEAYLKSYPNGKFAAIAQARIVQLAAAEQPVANVDEGDTTQAEQNTKVKQNQQADDQNQQASNQTDDQNQSDNGQNTQNQQASRFTEGSPDAEDSFLDREGRHEMQGRLSSLGFNTFGSDGAFGPNTRNAISNWQHTAGAPANGYLSGDQIAAIRKQSQVTYSSWLNAQRVKVVRRPVIVEEERVVVRPRRKVIVEEREQPGVDAAIAAGVIGGVLGATMFHGHRCHRRWC